MSAIDGRMSGPYSSVGDEHGAPGRDMGNRPGAAFARGVAGKDRLVLYLVAAVLALCQVVQALVPRQASIPDNQVQIIAERASGATTAVSDRVTVVERGVSQLQLDMKELIRSVGKIEGALALPPRLGGLQ